MTICAPIAFFAYNRPEVMLETLNSLRHCDLSISTDLFVFCDGARAEADLRRVQEVRRIARSVAGFNSVRVIEASTNKGLANSIIDGVSLVLKSYESVIVVEDDLIFSPDFLVFMNSALLAYADTPSIASISGFSFELPDWAYGFHSDVGFSRRTYPWGWATWRDRWVAVNMHDSDFSKFDTSFLHRCSFSLGGSDLVPMLCRQRSGLSDSWMIRWVYAQFLAGKFDVFPRRSLVVNKGFGDDATHTFRGSARFTTVLRSRSLGLFDFHGFVRPKLAFDLFWIWKHSFFRRGVYRIFELARGGK